MEEAKNWYQTINDTCKELAAKHNLTLQQVAGIMTELSAQKQFEENLKQTIQICEGKKVTGMYSKKQLNNCEKIINGEDPDKLWHKNTQKYRHFYRSILLEDGACCVDSHMINMYLELHPYSTLFNKTKDNIFSAKKHYRTIQKWIEKEAKRMGVKTYEAQAILWVEQRGQMF